ncbi:MAG: lipopolysaccharide biosynthesis protein [Rhizomicrobium sp.]
MLRGSAWMVGLRWAVRLTGVVSTVIMARLLTPADFGVVAIAMIFVGLFEMLSQTGQALAIIRHESPTREHYDSAWTISVLFGFAIALAIIILAPLTKYYFHDPRSIVVMQCLALRPAVGGVENIGIVDFRRELRFDRVFVYSFSGKLFAFCVTIGLGIVLRSYWALVAGIIGGQLCKTVVSYIIHPYRPRLSFREVAGIWSFSIWTFVRAIGNYFSGQVDHIAVGGIAGAPSMGRYSVAADVASSPSYEINEPMVTVLYPVMARLQNRPEQLRQLYLRTLGWSAVICTSAAVGVSLVAPEMVRLVLGHQWLDVIPLVPWLALAAGLNGLRSGAYTILDAIGLPRLGARLTWFRVIMLGLAVFPVAYITHDLVAIAMTQLIAMAIFIPGLFLTVGRRIGVSPQDYGRALWRPFAAAAFMAVVVTSANRLVPLAGDVKLAFDVATGAAAYSFAIVTLWLASGRPPSPEKDLVSLNWLRKANA